MNDGITFEEPQVMTYQNVMFWESESKELLRLKKNGDVKSATLLSKAKKFLENNCIEKISASKWEIKPIKNYNKTTYFVEDTNKGYTCTCQGFSRNSGFCSHILAVKQWIFMWRHENG